MLAICGSILLCTLAVAEVASSATLEVRQVISREHPLFNVGDCRMNVGRDGKLYFSVGEYVFRMERDGTARLGSKVIYALVRASANRDGLIGTGHAHFSHSLGVWRPDFTPIGAVNDFLNSDTAQWYAPSDIQAGEQEFFGIDQNRGRIVRVSPDARLHGTFSLAALNEDFAGKAPRFRVWETGERFYVLGNNGLLSVVDFKGAKHWSVPTKLGGDPWGGWRGAFDVDDAGRLHLLEEATGVVQVYTPDGKVEQTVKLDFGKREGGTEEERARGTQIQDLSVWADEYFVKRRDPIELCAVFDRTTGARRRTLQADVEVLAIASPQNVWKAGEPAPLTITFRSPSNHKSPRWRAWLRPLGGVKFIELPMVEGSVKPPADAGGLYHLRVTPDVQGQASEYLLDACVEIRHPGAIGSVSLFTPRNRRYYGRGEAIPVSVLLRGLATDLPRELELRLADGAKTWATERVSLEPQKAVVWQIPADLTNRLPPGEYVVTADAPQLSVAPQHLEIGPGLGARPKFHIVQHGDYTPSFPEGTWADLPDKIAAHIDRCRKLNVNLFVDRFGTRGRFWDVNVEPPGVAERLARDPLAPAAEKAVFEDCVSGTVAALGAYGIEQQGILVGMDGGLPLGTLFDPRKPEVMVKVLEDASRHLAAYPAMRGWSWAANWWLEKSGAAAAASPDESAAYQVALKDAKETGKWSAVLDTVSDRTFAHAVDAERQLRAALEKVAPGKLSCMTGPYRAIQTHPPIIFQNADEVDLHFQAEQIQPPQVTPHEVDYYKRPGKPAWGHPEIWNDDGTGSMLLPTQLQMVMRGADGIGWSGALPGPVSPADNARQGAPGFKSVLRAVDSLLSAYGPWLATLENADRLVIVVSTRMARIEAFDGKIGSVYFDQLFEAYNACLYAHRPASFVFVEDLKPDTLARFKAVLLVGQQVELEPPLAAALDAARQAGGRIFCDETCRGEIIDRYEPLGIAFNRLSSDPSAWQDDSAYHRFPRYFREHAARLRSVLGPLVPAVAETDDADLVLSERRQGEGRFIWVINNTIPSWDPGTAWRVGLLMSQRLPVMASLVIQTRDEVVYDVFADKILSPEQAAGASEPRYTVDLTVWPARLLAVLPKHSSATTISALRGLRPEGKTAPPVAELFGPHVKGLAVAADGKTALASTFNFADNLHAIDLATGKISWSRRIGHQFALDPLALDDGFAATGFDVHSAEGYHLYRLDPSGRVSRRFALFGLPKRATHWFLPAILQDPTLASFAVSSDGAWVAAGGDLGFAVWSRDGALLWSEDSWKTDRRRNVLLALDPQTLVSLNGTSARAQRASDGKALWQLKLADTGDLLGGAVSADRQTLALWADTLGGRIFIVRDGKLISTLPTPVDSLDLSPDGRQIVVVTGSSAKWYSVADGLVWTFTGDDVLRRPRISPDGGRVVVGSELGTLTVVDANGTVAFSRDFGSLPVAGWLPDGGLLAASWMGRMERFDPNFRPLWQTLLTLPQKNMAEELVALEKNPTARMTGWGNACQQDGSLDDNLFSKTPAFFQAVSDPPTPGEPKTLKNPVEILFDGKPEAPPQPWLEWTDIQYIDSGWRGRLALTFGAWHSQFRAKGITLVEDGQHPESWLRDARLEWWDAESDVWRAGPYLLSNQARHTHWFEKPIEAGKFRLLSTGGGGWPVGNVRLGELVLHGEVLGAGHRDVIAGRKTAVLFDERESDLADMLPPLQYRNDDGASGTKSIWFSKAGGSGANYRPATGHAIPGWDFEVAENPGPGQYRWLQFAWKATSQETTGLLLQLGRPFPSGGYTFTAGKIASGEGTLVEHHLSDQLPLTWQTVRVDLWEMFHQQPVRIQCLRFLTEGGGGQFDQIVLGQSAADLPPERR